MPGATGCSATEQGSDLGGSGSTVELRRNHGETVQWDRPMAGQTDGRTDLKRKKPFVLGTRAEKDLKFI